MSPDLRHRDTELTELMDDPACDEAALRRTYARFRVVNRLIAGWRATFGLAAVFGLALLAVVGPALPETLARRAAEPLSLGGILRGFRRLLEHRGYRRHVGLAALTYGGLFAFISGSAFVLQGPYGLEDQPRAGRPTTYPPKQVAEVLAAALTDPTTLGLPFGSWTLDRLQAYLNEHKAIPIKRSRIDEILLAEAGDGRA